METRFDFRLGFVTNRNEIKKINVPHARHTATVAEVADAMLGIINSNVVQSAAGEPRFRTSAELIRTERREFNI